jgi:hypothetical protein
MVVETSSARLEHGQVEPGVSEGVGPGLAVSHGELPGHPTTRAALDATLGVEPPHALSLFSC